MNSIKKLNQNKDYLKERMEFYYLLNNENLSLAESDGENYLIGQGDKKYPIWLWNKDNLSKEKWEEIKKLLKEEYHLEEENILICKKECYEELAKAFQISNCYEMGYLACEKLKFCKETPGIFAKANYGDKIVLAKLWQSFLEEIEKETVELNECLEEVTELLKKDCFYVWKDYQGKVISMASYSVEKDVAKISHVYTRKEERNKGYCTSLIYHLTKKLLEENLQPMLYTDYHYQASNKSYKKIGYQEKGVLIRLK